MADGVFNIAKGSIKYYAGLPGASDALEVRLLKASGLEADDTLNNYDTLATLVAASNDLCDFTNYATKTLGSTSVTVTVDDTNNRCDIAITNQTWTSAGGASNNTVGKLIVCYKPSTGASSTAIIPLSYHDFNVTTNGTDLTAQFNSAGVMRAA